MKWRELELEQKDKTDHRLAFMLGILEAIGNRIVASNGVTPEQDTDPDRFYMNFEKPDGNAHIKQMFDTIKALAEAQNARNNRDT